MAGKKGGSPPEVRKVEGKIPSCLHQQFMTIGTSQTILLTATEILPEPLRKEAIVHIKGLSQPFRGIEELEEVPMMAPPIVGLDHRLQKGRPQGSAAEFQTVYQPQVVGRIFRSYEG